MTAIIVIASIVLFFYFIHKSTQGTKSNNVICSFCASKLTEVTRVENRLGMLDDGKMEMCVNCFSKVIEESRKTGRKKFLDDEIIKIINIKTERPLPKSDLKQFVPNNEVAENNNFTKADTIVLNSLAQISYTDLQGQKSKRRITIKSFYKSVYDSFENDYTIDAFCHEKQATRIFKLSRISELVDMETGEIFNDPSKYFLERYTDSPIGQITRCFEELESEILILTFMARADGHLQKRKREIIADFIQQKHNLSLDSKLLDDEIRRAYCDSFDFRKALKKLNKYPETDKMLVLKSATDIANTDKKRDPIELGILELIKKELKIKPNA